MNTAQQNKKPRVFCYTQNAYLQIFSEEIKDIKTKFHV